MSKYVNKWQYFCFNRNKTNLSIKLMIKTAHRNDMHPKS